MTALSQLRHRFFQFNALQKALGLMAWDMQVLMPKGGVPARTAHSVILSRMAHETLIADETQRWVEDASADAEPGSDDAAVLRVLRREIELRAQLPIALVEEKARTASNAYEVWRVARATNDFQKLAPYLERLFDIAVQTAELRGYQDHIYDPLVDSFEQGATFAHARAMFDAIKDPIKGLLAQAAENPVDDSFLYDEWDAAKLLAFSRKIAAEIGFDFDRGRIDLTTNAFCLNCSCDDVRMTARNSSHIGGILFSALHEMGHGLYEQNSPHEWDRTPLAGGISLGVHESQSRTWENIVGRSRGLWTRFFPELRTAFPALGNRSTPEFYRGINKAQPTPIRIGSDELSYNFHILIRFELECEILTGQVRIQELPEAWNEKYRLYLGITPKNDTEGCLQDVHWSRGSIGYFPTYSMGNMIGWQIWDTMKNDVPDPDDLMAKGNFSPILDWLTNKVYRQGRRHTPHDLVLNITGKPMGTESYIAGMKQKIEGLWL